MSYKEYASANVSDLIGKTLKDIEVAGQDESIIFYCDDGVKYIMHHCQECCECVSIEDICGNIKDLIGSPITMAEEETNSDNPKDEYNESFTWTFYKLATSKGYVTIRWYGKSNGYYSESVYFEKLKR